jgi:hypothetical protein
MNKIKMIHIVTLLQPHIWDTEQRYFCLDIETAEKYKKELEQNGFQVKIENRAVSY